MHIFLLALALASSPELGSSPETEAADAGLGAPPLGDPPSPAEVNRRTQALAGELRCPVCQGLSVAASPSEGARAMRDRIEGLVAQGYTDEQIVDYFVDRYGTWILLEPPKEGLKWFLWIGPVALVAAGGLGLLARGRRREVVPTPTAAPDAPKVGPDDPYRARALAELDGPETR